MAETTNNVPTKTEKTLAPPQAQRRFAGIRREIGSLYEDFFGRSPSSTRRRSFLDLASRRARVAFGAIPAVHFTETNRAYEINSQLPGGMSEKDVEVTFANGVLTIKGEKQEEREEKKKGGYHMQERSFGSFERTVRVPEDVDADKIKTSFKKGVLAVTLPKKTEARGAERKVGVKAG